MYLAEILDTQELLAEIRAGYVSKRQHPEFPNLWILNYTDRCQFDSHWTKVTRQTRGLIVQADGHDAARIVARPFKKFFNYPESDVEYSLDAPIVGAFDKMDGSLGIGYIAPDGSVRIATRGSFDSEQARHANEWLAQHDDYADAISYLIRGGKTPLFEIIYPENRIVVDYGNQDELIYLGSVSNESGVFHPSTDLRASSDPGTLREVLSLPPRDNAEGWVVWLTPRTAVKIKYEQYLALHRIVSSLTKKEVWRQLRAGTFDEFAAALPDEFHGWARGEAKALREDFNYRYQMALWALRDLPDDTRKEQALWIQRNVKPEFRGLVFGLLDGKDVSDSIWRLVEPKGESSPTLEGSAA